MRRRLPLGILWLALACAFSPRAQAGESRLARGLELVALDGRKVSLDAARSHGPVLLDFWATWCKPCLASLPEVQALSARYAERGLTVIGISIDGPRNRARVRPFAARLGLTYPVVFDEDGALAERFDVRAVPTVVLIDTTGAVVRLQAGYRPGETRDLARAIEAQLR